MSRCWCCPPGIQISECSGASTDHGKTSPFSAKVLGWLRSRSMQNLNILDLGGPSPIGDRNCFTISRPSIQKCQDIVGLIGVKDGHGLLVEEVIEPKNPGWAVKKMGRNGRVYCCFCQDVCLFSFPLTGVFLNWFMRGGTCEIFIRLRFDSFTQKLP